jgi:3-hydroxybutyryl-CoA dehydrogenase
MSSPRFHTAAVIGTGMMGPGIAASLALGGIPAVIVSRTSEGATRGLDAARAHLRSLAENGLAEVDEAARAGAALSASSDFDTALAQADLMIESTPENMEFKQKLFARMDAAARPEAVLASNPSGLSITAIASACSRPERVLTTHFWNPAHLMPLVEIVRGERTSPEAVSAVRELLMACGKTPVVVKKDRPGQLGNRLQMALVREAVHIIAEGIADVEDFDTVAKKGFVLRFPAYGIFEHQDAVGLDMALSINEYVSGDLYNLPHAPAYYHAMVARGDLGVKTGKGFYDWSKKSIAEVKERRDRFIIEFLRAEKAASRSSSSPD